MWPTTRDAQTGAPGKAGDIPNESPGAASPARAGAIHKPRYDSGWRTFVLSESELPASRAGDDDNLSESWLQPMFYEDDFTQDKDPAVTDNGETAGSMREEEKPGALEASQVEIDTPAQPPVQAQPPIQAQPCRDMGPEAQNVWIKTVESPYKTPEEEFYKTRYPIVMGSAGQTPQPDPPNRDTGVSGRPCGCGQLPAVPVKSGAVALNTGGINIPDHIFTLLLFRLLALCLRMY